jgi:amino acid transporter
MDGVYMPTDLFCSVWIPGLWPILVVVIFLLAIIIVVSIRGAPAVKTIVAVVLAVLTFAIFFVLILFIIVVAVLLRDKSTLAGSWRTGVGDSDAKGLEDLIDSLLRNTPRQNREHLHLTFLPSIPCCTIVVDKVEAEGILVLRLIFA